MSLRFVAVAAAIYAAIMSVLLPSGLAAVHALIAAGADPGTMQQVMGTAGLIVNLVAMAGALEGTLLAWPKLEAAGRTPPSRLMQALQTDKWLVVALTSITLTAIDAAALHIAAYAYDRSVNLGIARLAMLAFAFGGITWYWLDHKVSRTDRQTFETRAKSIFEELAADYRKLSAGDRSVLHASLAQGNSTLLTTRASPNDRFWEKLARLGWMQRDQLPEGLRDEPHARALAAWRLTEAGANRIPGFLRAVADAGH